ncbi:hypothetical protein BTUL_0205g00210 [Botrytis tulipae]|uniref:Uncharacterized protein n=1 Tax=Botrytis tulipae TaxID=87230 RepID=A0A4Z1EBD8_9HELO|nr:hypothetical protein BTUL_0205g00210 [Botrytis tulipae]
MSILASITTAHLDAPVKIAAEDLTDIMNDSNVSDSRCFPSGPSDGVDHVFPTTRSQAFVAAKAENGDSTMMNESENEQKLMLTSLQESTPQITGIIEEEARLVSMDTIILIGISQDWATAVSMLPSPNFNISGASWSYLLGCH